MPREERGNGATFQLDRFEWAAPDRLEIAGSFAGVDAPSVTPTLVVGSGEGGRRLTGTPLDSDVGGEQWTAAFLWQEPPLAFEAAELELGHGLSVVLPAPGSSDEALAIRGGAPPAADTLRLQAALLAAEEEAREVQSVHRRALQELARARDDLEAERSAHAADAERFKHGLAQVRDAGEQALAASEAELATLRERVRELEAEVAETAALRAELEQAGVERDELRKDVERAEAEMSESRDALERAQSGAAEADRLKSHLDAVRRALEDGP